MKLADQIQTAEAKLTNLQRACEDAEAERDKAEKSYAAHRTPELFIARSVATDIAADAALAVTEQAQAIERLREQQRVEARQSLTEKLNSELASVLKDFDAAGAQLVAAVEAWDAATSRLAQQHHARFDAQQQGALVPPVSLQRLVGALNDRFGTIRGAYAAQQNTTNAVANLHDQGNDAVVIFTFTRPAGHVARPLRT